MRWNLDGSGRVEICNVFALGAEDFKLGGGTVRDRASLELLDDGKGVEGVFDFACVRFCFWSVRFEACWCCRFEEQFEHLWGRASQRGRM